jgi:predicted nucleic acid-binding protein
MKAVPARRGDEHGRDVLIDTPVWSLALRRNAVGLNPTEKDVAEVLADLVRGGRARILGVIRQEVLSGIREESVFNRIRDHLRSFDEPRLEISDYEQAAEMNNRCRIRGIAGSPIDFLICAVAHRRGWQIFTLDQDFKHYDKVLGISLHV